MEVTIKDIYTTIRSVPPFQEERAAEAYREQEILWVVSFISLNNGKNDVYDVLCHDPEGTVFSISFGINIKEHPEFKLLSRGEKLKIRAKIERVDPKYLYIKLNNIYDIVPIKNDQPKDNLSTKKKSASKREEGLGVDNFLGKILFHPVYSLIILGFIIFIIYRFTGKNLKDFLP